MEHRAQYLTCKLFIGFGVYLEVRRNIPWGDHKGKKIMMMMHADATTMRMVWFKTNILRVET